MDNLPRRTFLNFAVLAGILPPSASASVASGQKQGDTLPPAWVQDLDALAALRDRGEGRVCLVGSELTRSGAGHFFFHQADVSAVAAIDRVRGLCVPPADAPDGRAGAWIRVAARSGELDLGWFARGLSQDSTADASDGLEAAVKLLQLLAPFAEKDEARLALYVPPDTFRLTRSGLLSQTTDLGLGNGYRIHGASRASVLWLDPKGLQGRAADDELWFYDNGATISGFENSFEMLTFAGGQDWRLSPPGFETSLVPNVDPRVKGFKFSGPGAESAHKFVNCAFRYLGEVMHLAGSNNADTIRHLLCEYQACRDHFFIDNRQAFDIEVAQSYCQIGFGNWLVFGPNATGGNFKMTGGAMINSDQGFRRFGSSHVVKSLEGGPGVGNANVSFDRVRMEVYDQNAVFDISFSNGGLFTFRECTILRTNRTAARFGRIGGRFLEVAFERCSIFSQERGGQTIVFAADLGYGWDSKLSFKDCTLPPNFHENVRFTGRGGWLKVEGGRSAEAVGAFDAAAEPQIVLLDADRFGDRYASPKARGLTLKCARIDLGFAPNTLAGVVTLLPPGAVIKQVHARVTAPAGPRIPYRLHISNGDKSLRYAVSKPADGGQIASSDLLLLNVDAGSTGRTLRLWADNGAGAAPPGRARDAAIEAFVEYY
jgi:hypothetical protein